MSCGGSSEQTAVDGHNAVHLRDLHFLQWLVVFSRELRVNGEGSASGDAASAA
jgi:hypothetical protein